MSQETDLEGLSGGALADIFTSSEEPTILDPVLQILSAKHVTTTQGTPRIRLVISDGKNFCQGMLATAINHLAEGDNPVVRSNTVVRVLGYALNSIQRKRIMIVLALDVIRYADYKIAAPVSIDIAMNAAGLDSLGRPLAEDGTVAPWPDASTDRGSSMGVSGSAPVHDAVSAPPPPVNAPAGNGVGRGGSNASRTSAAKRGGAQNGGGGGNGNLAKEVLYPIESLSPYQNKWTIKVRVTQKSDIKHYTNKNGDGQLFSCNFLDETGEIRATGFNKDCERLYPLLEEGKVYRVSRARVNIAKKQFSNLSNEYELMFSADTEVEPVDDAEEKSVPKVQFNFVQLADLPSHEKDTTCDVIGIVQDHGAVTEITAKATQKQIKKRELTIADRSQYAVRVTLWGRQAENWDENNASIVALKGVKVGDFGGRTLSVSGQTVVSIDPDIDEAHELQGWYQTEGQNTNFQTFSSAGMGPAAGAATFRADQFKTLKAVVEENIGMHGDQEFFSTRATVTYVKGDNLSYPACPTDRCNKKMNQEGERQWRCEKCSTTYEAPEYRYILSMCVNDYTNQIWVSGFNDVGKSLFGKTADEMQALKEDDDPEFQRSINNALGQTLNLSIKAKADTYGDQVRVRYQIQSAAHVDWVAAAKQLADEIEKW